jgi:hypothetical protein
MRKTRYEFNSVDFVQFRQRTNREQVMNALGYLTTWNMSYPEVMIALDLKHREMSAYYYREGKCGHVIGAIWHDDGRSSFHS